MGATVRGNAEASMNDRFGEMPGSAGTTGTRVRPLRNYCGPGFATGSFASAGFLIITNGSTIGSIPNVSCALTAARQARASRKLRQATDLFEFNF